MGSAVLNLNALSAAMGGVRYVCVRDAESTDVGGLRAREIVYKASWAPDDVKHFLSLQVYKGRLTARFGLKNSTAEAFALASIRAYGGETYRMTLLDSPTSCKMSFDVARLVCPGRSWSLHVNGMSGLELAQSVEESIRIHVVPFVDNTLTPKAVLARLLADDEPCRWFVTNAAIRYAEIIALGMMTGMDLQQIRTSLKPYDREFSYVRAPYSPTDYVEHLIEDWESFRASIGTRDSAE